MEGFQGSKGVKDRRASVEKTGPITHWPREAARAVEVWNVRSKCDGSATEGNVRHARSMHDGTCTAVLMSQSPKGRF